MPAEQAPSPANVQHIHQVDCQPPVTGDRGGREGGQAIATIGARLRLAESRGPKARLDVPGLVLVSAGVGVLIWGLVAGGQDGWGSAQSLTGLTAGTVLLGGFIAWETRAREPMIPLGLFRRITFSAAVTAAFLTTAAIYSAAFLTSQFFQFALGDTPLGTGLRFLPWTATPLLVAPAAGAISDKTSPRALVVPGLLLQAAGFAWIVALAASSAGYAGYVLPFVIAGTGISMALPCVTAGALNAAPPALLGKGAGTLNTMQQFGAVFGIAVVTAVFNAHGSLAGPAAVTSGYGPALAVSAAISVLGAITAIAMRWSTAGAQPPAPGETLSPELAPGVRT